MVIGPWRSGWIEWLNITMSHSAIMPRPASKNTIKLGQWPVMNSLRVGLQMAQSGRRSETPVSHLVYSTRPHFVQLIVRLFWAVKYCQVSQFKPSNTGFLCTTAERREDGRTKGTMKLIKFSLLQWVRLEITCCFFSHCYIFSNTFVHFCFSSKQ